MKKFLIQIVVLLLVSFAGLLSVFNPSLLGITSFIPGGGIPGGGSMVSQDASYQQVLFIDALSTGNPELVKSVLTVEVADIPEKRSKGLSYRDSMSQDAGMLFLFDSPSRVRFIMTGMRFPLDFLWVRDSKIVDILENVPPDPAQKAEEASQFYQPITEINKVIEVNAGYIKKHNLKVGDTVKIQELQYQ